jgi:hypothetical protein|tara:strand:- start:9660 stop:9788 length:129 start_codon:yes stop_codon:yes gene_type:complete
MSVARERVAVRDVDVSRFFQSSRDFDFGCVAARETRVAKKRG